MSYNIGLADQCIEAPSYQNPKELVWFAQQRCTTHHGHQTQTTLVVFLLVLIRGALKDKVGGLDPIFSFGNCEDSDYCFRAYRAGFKALIMRDVYIDHVGSASFQKQLLPMSNSFIKTSSMPWGKTSHKHCTINIVEPPSMNVGHHCVHSMNSGCSADSHGRFHPKINTVTLLLCTRKLHLDVSSSIIDMVPHSAAASRTNRAIYHPPCRSSECSLHRTCRGTLLAIVPRRSTTSAY